MGKHTHYHLKFKTKPLPQKHCYFLTASVKFDLKTKQKEFTLSQKKKKAQKSPWVRCDTGGPLKWQTIQRMRPSVHLQSHGTSTENTAQERWYSVCDVEINVWVILASNFELISPDSILILSRTAGEWLWGAPEALSKRALLTWTEPCRGLRDGKAFLGRSGGWQELSLVQEWMLMNHRPAESWPQLPPPGWVQLETAPPQTPPTETS